MESSPVESECEALRLSLPKPPPGQRISPRKVNQTLLSLLSSFWTTRSSEGWSVLSARWWLWFGGRTSSSLQAPWPRLSSASEHWMPWRTWSQGACLIIGVDGPYRCLASCSA